MKKVLTGIIVIMAIINFNVAAIAAEKGCKCSHDCGCALNKCECDFNIEGLYDGCQAVYMPSTNTWTTGGMAEDRIILTKKVSEGSGNYSEYYSSNGKLAAALSSDFEFIKDNQLFAVDNASLKYYKVVYQNSNFVQVQLTEEELQQVFPNAEIIKISQFHNGKLIVNKKLFKNKEILLVNDTDKYFHKYSFNPSKIQKTDVKGLLKIEKFGKIEFSLFGENENKLTIYVR